MAKFTSVLLVLALLALSRGAASQATGPTTGLFKVVDVLQKLQRALSVAPTASPTPARKLLIGGNIRPAKAGEAAQGG